MRSGRCGREMKTDFPYRFSMYEWSRSQEQSDKTATIHIVHRKTENKSHVRAHNVWATLLVLWRKKKCFFFLFCSVCSCCCPRYDLSYYICPKWGKKNGEKRNDFLWLKMVTKLNVVWYAHGGLEIGLFVWIFTFLHTIDAFNFVLPTEHSMFFFTLFFAMKSLQSPNFRQDHSIVLQRLDEKRRQNWLSIKNFLIKFRIQFKLTSPTYYNFVF